MSVRMSDLRFTEPVILHALFCDSWEESPLGRRLGLGAELYILLTTRLNGSVDSSVRKLQDAVIVFIFLLVILVIDLDLDREGSHQSPEHSALEAQGSKHDVGPLPAVDI